MTMICGECGVEQVAESYIDSELCKGCGDLEEMTLPYPEALDFNPALGRRPLNVITEIEDGFHEDGDIEDGGDTGC